MFPLQLQNVFKNLNLRLFCVSYMTLLYVKRNVYAPDY